MNPRISSQFDGGAIIVVDTAPCRRHPRRVARGFARRHRQWFYFRLQGAAGRAARIRITNAGQATYADGWPGYAAVASYDRASWFRVPTRFDGKELVIEHAPLRDSVYYAYFEPYSWERHLALLGRADASPRARVGDLGATVDGPRPQRRHRGHAGRRQEVAVDHCPPASGRNDGRVVRRGDAGPTARCQRSGGPRAGGARSAAYRAEHESGRRVRGNLRTNAAGANLNREWMAPSLERSPEVLHVRAAMEANGVDGFLDVHGDEALPYVFTDGNERLANYSPRMAALEQGVPVGISVCQSGFSDASTAMPPTRRRRST